MESAKSRRDKNIDYHLFVYEGKRRGESATLGVSITSKSEHMREMLETLFLEECTREDLEVLGVDEMNPLDNTKVYLHFECVSPFTRHEECYLFVCYNGIIRSVSRSSRIALWVRKELNSFWRKSDEELCCLILRRVYEHY